MADYELRMVGVFHRPSGLVITPKMAEWKQYQAWLGEHNVPDPMPAPVVVTPPAAQFDFVKAGAALDRRRLEEEAKTNPTLKALLDKGLVK
jgi:hypothetical protein